MPRRPATVEVGDPAQPGETRVRRAALSPDKLVERPHPDILTMADILPYTAKTYGKKHAAGWRDIVKIHKENKEVTKTVGGKEVKGACLSFVSVPPLLTPVCAFRDQDVGVL